MNITPELYNEMSKNVSPKSNFKVNAVMAFLIGGGICALGQIVMEMLMYFELSKETASAWTSVILVGLSTLLTGFGLYERIAKHAGAGTLVPITGFSNAIASSAIEAKTEGFILGVDRKSVV